MNKIIQTCSNCILDNSGDPDIFFNYSGICNYCCSYIQKYGDIDYKNNEKILEKLIDKVKNASRKGKYDCIMGLSGGVDSSYLAYLAKKWGLNPLVVHFDNGWNSELAVQNIEGIIKKTGFDLYTYVVDWNEFKDLQLSYVKAGVIDWEIPTDHGFLACLLEQAKKNNIKYILTGHNHQTEFILPKYMRWSKWDAENLLDIHRKYGTKKLRSFPLMRFYKRFYLNIVMGFEQLSPMDLIDYKKDLAKEIIKKEFGWKDYGGKHYESLFTRFYQGYVLKEKFGVDKRKAHLSNLILSGQITREQALQEIQKPAYSPELLEQDFNYVAKKFDLTIEEFKQILNQPNHSHLEYKSYETGLYRKHEKFMKAIKPFTSIVKKLLGK